MRQRDRRFLSFVFQTSSKQVFVFLILQYRTIVDTPADCSGLPKWSVSRVRRDRWALSAGIHCKGHTQSSDNAIYVHPASPSLRTLSSFLSVTEFYIVPAVGSGADIEEQGRLKKIQVKVMWPRRKRATPRLRNKTFWLMDRSTMKPREQNMPKAPISDTSMRAMRCHATAAAAPPRPRHFKSIGQPLTRLAWWWVMT